MAEPGAGVAPPPAPLPLTVWQAEALETIREGVLSNDGLTVITGPAACGKTTTAQMFAQEALNAGAVLISVADPAASGDDPIDLVMQTVASVRGGGHQDEKIGAITGRLLALANEERPAVLLVDDAERLDPVWLQGLSALSALQDHVGKLLQIVLIGRPALEEMLVDRNLPSLQFRRMHVCRMGADAQIATSVLTAPAGLPPTTQPAARDPGQPAPPKVAEAPPATPAPAPDWSFTEPEREPDGGGSEEDEFAGREPESAEDTAEASPQDEPTLRDREAWHLYLTGEPEKQPATGKANGRSRDAAEGRRRRLFVGTALVACAMAGYFGWPFVRGTAFRDTGPSSREASSASAERTLAMLSPPAAQSPPLSAPTLSPLPAPAPTFAILQPIRVAASPVAPAMPAPVTTPATAGVPGQVPALTRVAPLKLASWQSVRRPPRALTAPALVAERSNRPAFARLAPVKLRPIPAIVRAPAPVTTPVLAANRASAPSMERIALAPVHAPPQAISAPDALRSPVLSASRDPALAPTPLVAASPAPVASPVLADVQHPAPAFAPVAPISIAMAPAVIGAPSPMVAPLPAAARGAAEAPARLATPAAPTKATVTNLMLIARPGDTLRSMYERVYSVVTPPPFNAVAALNPAPVVPGAIVFFPTPPDGWTPKR